MLLSEVLGWNGFKFLHSKYVGQNKNGSNFFFFVYTNLFFETVVELSTHNLAGICTFDPQSLLRVN